jgi:hypothetical protein
MPTFVLDFRLTDVDGPVMAGRLTLGHPTMDDLQQCANVVFLVHGFNVDRPTGSAELQKLATLLPGIGDGGAVAVLWPGDSSVGPVSYPFETNKADDTAVELAKFIGDNLPQKPRISFVAHSLGSRVVMATVRHLWIMDIPVEQICLMAAAIDNDSLAAADAYRAATQCASRVAVLHSTCDTVLRYAYPAGNLLSAFMHWTATSDAALGYTGPRAASGTNGDIPGDVQHFGIPQSDAVTHSDYLPNAQGPATDKQLAAARYANSIVAGTLQVTY